MSSVIEDEIAALDSTESKSDKIIIKTSNTGTLVKNENELNLANVNAELETVHNNNLINLEQNEKSSENEDSPKKLPNGIINEEAVKREVNDVCGADTSSGTDPEKIKIDACTDFIGLEKALMESNVKEPFLEALCSKMVTVVKSPGDVDSVLVKTFSTDDSTDVDVSYTDSSPPESDHGIGSTFADQTLQEEVENRLKNEIERLNWRILELEKEASHEFCQNRIDGMEKSMGQLKLELELSRQEHALDCRGFANDRLELEMKIENLKKQYESANKEKEAAVVRYAVGEMEVMSQKKERESTEKKLKDCTKEKELLINKLKTLTSEKSRISQMLDNKCTDLVAALKDAEHIKDEMTNRDIKLKWVQNKLKTETEGRKEAEGKLESMNEKVQSSLQEAEQAKQDALEAIRKFQESEENKAFTLGQQLKEEQVRLMLLQHEQEDRENARQQLQKELETCRTKLQASIDENNSLSLKVQSLEKERLAYEQNLYHLKQETDSQSRTIAELQASVQELEALRVQLHCEQERLAGNQSEVERLRQSNSELVQDMKSCRKREEDMLEFTQKLTAKNVRLQSEFTVVEAKAQQLEFERGPMQRKMDELEAKVDSLTKDLNQEKGQRAEESKVLARHVAEKTARVKTLETQIDDLMNETQLVKRKNTATLRELNRELAQYRKRAELIESGSGSDSLCQGSRTSSCASLNDQPSNSVSTPASAASVSNSSHLQIEPNSQILIERIAKLQRENAKVMEKLDFLEEHTRTLVVELQKKSRVLQSYILREEAGALSSGAMDLNKAELSKHGGIMASVYGSKSVDETMTLELSLEINHKLQAVLEDTLLKNITLKENIDTLGDEIARLTQQKRIHS